MLPSDTSSIYTSLPLPRGQTYDILHFYIIVYTSFFNEVLIV